MCSFFKLLVDRGEIDKEVGVEREGVDDVVAPAHFTDGVHRQLRIAHICASVRVSDISEGVCVSLSLCVYVCVRTDSAHSEIRTHDGSNGGATRHVVAYDKVLDRDGVGASNVAQESSRVGARRIPLVGVELDHRATVHGRTVVLWSIRKGVVVVRVSGCERETGVLLLLYLHASLGSLGALRAPCPMRS